MFLFGLSGHFVLFTSNRSSDWEFGQMLLFLPIILGIFYFFGRKDIKKQNISIPNLYIRHGFHEVVEFRKYPQLAANRMLTYTLPKHTAKRVFTGSHKSHEIEFIETNEFYVTSGPHPQVPFTEKHDSLVMSNIKGLPDFLIIPISYSENVFSQNPKQNMIASLPKDFTRKYLLDAEPASIQSISKSFLDYVTNHPSVFIIESKENSLAITKLDETLNEGFDLQNMLARADIIANLLTNESSTLSGISSK